MSKNLSISGDKTMQKKHALGLICLTSVALISCNESDSKNCDLTCLDESTLSICGDSTIQCPNGCFEGMCKTCADGALKCENNASYRCEANSWVLTQTCTAGCNGFRCQSTDGICTDGASKCENNTQYNAKTARGSSRNPAKKAVWTIPAQNAKMTNENASMARN